MSLLLTALLLVPAFGTDASDPAAKQRISFGEDGKLTILQAADIQDDAFLSYFCKRSIVYAVQAAQPDLIVLTGDNISGPSCKTELSAKKAIRDVMDVFERLGVPVVMVFGNHDDEKTQLDKLEQIEQYEKYDCFIGCAGVVAELTVGDNSTLNAGTYNIPVYESADSDKIAYNIWCFDSGNYNPDPQYGGYGYVLPEQVDWYVKTSDALKAANGGEPVPSIAFQHIIPPHIWRALRETDAGTPGAVEHGGRYYVLPDGVDPETNWLSETPCPPSAACESAYAEVDAMLRQGDVKAKGSISYPRRVARSAPTTISTEGSASSRSTRKTPIRTRRICCSPIRCCARAISRTRCCTVSESSLIRRKPSSAISFNQKLQSIKPSVTSS